MTQETERSTSPQSGPDRPERFLCISSYEKGQDFLRQLSAQGVKPTLLTVDKLRDADWPRDVLEEMVTMPAGLTRDQILNTVTWVARTRRFDRIVALDEFDLEIAAKFVNICASEAWVQQRLPTIATNSRCASEPRNQVFLFPRFAGY